MPIFANNTNLLTNKRHSNWPKQSNPKHNTSLWKPCKGRQSKWGNYKALATVDNFGITILFPKEISLTRLLTETKTIWRTMLMKGFGQLIETTRDMPFLRIILKPQISFYEHRMSSEWDNMIGLCWILLEGTSRTKTLRQNFEKKNIVTGIGLMWIKKTLVCCGSSVLCLWTATDP